MFYKFFLFIISLSIGVALKIILYFVKMLMEISFFLLKSTLKKYKKTVFYAEKT